MAKPEITVLMTVYNGGEYLKASIDSVLKQSFLDFEFLIINDQSNDQSEGYIKSFKDERIRLVNNESNLGQTRSLNKGLSLAQGRYVARIDADDLAFPTWLEKNLALLKSQPLTAVASCKAVVIDGANKIQKVLNTPTVYEEMVLRSLFATPLNHVGSIYKADVIASVGGYDEKYRIAADFGLWSKLIRRGIRLAALEEALVAVRVHEKSASIIERGRADIVEITDIMAANLKYLVGSGVSQDEILLLWKLNYATDQLSAKEFQAADVLFCKVYENINSEVAISRAVIANFVKHQKYVFYAKRVLVEIAKGDLPQLRALIRSYCKSQGWFNIFSLLWLGSWLGKRIMINLPLVYERWRGWSARRKVQIQDYPEGIH